MNGSRVDIIASLRQLIFSDAAGAALDFLPEQEPHKKDAISNLFLKDPVLTLMRLRLQVKFLMPAPTLLQSEPKVFKQTLVYMMIEIFLKL
jgi:hypothetical protein